MSNRKHNKELKLETLALAKYIEGFYNRQGLHSTLGYLSPEQFEQQQNIA